MKAHGLVYLRIGHVDSFGLMIHRSVLLSFRNAELPCVMINLHITS